MAVHHRRMNIVSRTDGRFLRDGVDVCIHHEAATRVTKLQVDEGEADVQTTFSNQSLEGLMSVRVAAGTTAIDDDVMPKRFRSFKNAWL